MKKHERGSDRLRSGSKPNSIGATTTTRLDVYVITLKSFNRIFDDSLADAFSVRWLYPTGPSEIINA